MGSNVVRADFGSGLICPKGSNMHGLKSGSCRFRQRTDSPRAQTCCALKSSAPSGTRQDNYADSGSACKLAGVQIIPLPTLANQILARTFFRSVGHLFAYPAVVCTLYGLKWATSVEIRHGLPISEARRCSFGRICLRAQPLESSLGRVPQAADGSCNKTS